MCAKVWNWRTKWFMTIGLSAGAGALMKGSLYNFVTIVTLVIVLLFESLFSVLECFLLYCFWLSVS